MKHCKVHIVNSMEEFWDLLANGFSDSRPRNWVTEETEDWLEAIQDLQYLPESFEEFECSCS